jgi:hypothetical protein
MTDSVSFPVGDSFESILDESISALQAGVPLEEILAEVPEYATELRPLLYAAAVVTDPNPYFAPEDRKIVLRAEYMKRVAELPAVTVPTFGEKLQAVLRIAQRRATPKAVVSDLVTMTVTAVLTLSMATLLLIYLAGDTLPGDFLYGLKRVSENAQLSLSVDPARRTELTYQFNQRRLAELNQLFQQKRAAVVEFSGALETKGENLWIIAGYTVLIPADVAIHGNPHEGDVVEVMGFLRTNQVLVADTIQIIQ